MSDPIGYRWRDPDNDKWQWSDTDDLRDKGLPRSAVERAIIEPVYGPPLAPGLAVKQLNAIVDAWEALPGGQEHKVAVIKEWLNYTLAPTIDKARFLLRRKRPDGSPYPGTMGN